MAPKIIDKTAKRGEILSAALRVFSEKGFKNTKIIDIADEAGIGKGTIYEYFRNKDEMLVAAFEDYRAELERNVESVLASNDSALDKIRAIVETTFEVCALDIKSMSIMFDFWLEGMQNKEQPQIDFRPIYTEFRKMISGLLREGARQGEVREDLPPFAAATIIAAIEGLFLQWMVDPDAFHVMDTQASVIDVLFRGLARKA